MGEDKEYILLTWLHKNGVYHFAKQGCAFLAFGLDFHDDCGYDDNEEEGEDDVGLWEGHFSSSLTAKGLLSELSFSEEDSILYCWQHQKQESGGLYSVRRNIKGPAEAQCVQKYSWVFW